MEFLIDRLTGRGASQDLNFIVYDGLMLPGCNNHFSAIRISELVGVVVGVAISVELPDRVAVRRHRIDT